MTAEPTEASVTQRASRAFGWSFGNTLFLRLGTLAIGIALARMLGPEEFGIFAIATVTLMAVLSFNELGVSLAVIRWRDAPAVIAPTINTIAVANSAILTAAVFFGAPWISAMLGDVRAAPVVQVIAISILLNGIVATSAAVMQREFMQKQRTIADQANTWLGAGLSLLFVLFGWGAMSLAIGRLIASIVFAVMILRWAPVPYRFGWDPAIARRLFKFGLPLAAASIIVFASGYADQMVVGSVLGAQALGFYVLAFNLATWPVSIFSLPLRAVAPAAFSAMKTEPERMPKNFARILALLSCVAIPACLALSGAADPIVAFVYGAAWLSAAEPLLWLAALAALKIWFELSYDYLVVAGRSSTVLIIQAATFVAALPLMLLVAEPYGVGGVAAVQFGVAAVIAAPLYLTSLARIGIRARAVMAAVALPLFGSLLTWGVGWMLSRTLGAPFLAAAAAGLFAMLVAGLLCLRHRGDLRILRTAARGGATA
ncbi:oligosaccharide flippase family protein [Microbacterium aerolatum]|uniref:Lipopolysaccharide biosynthesis protein n=1 Tax=Microbacterium aerolatum TaxID=153731 RepID=A0A511AE00_9MICO|nr:oligosaccharide flippase family protein [Microbacterium aerolatum]GEK86262.1 lipopolysaccharide biosynthesis protein [Microbacterium aerolatum]GGB16565.1 lipopolysaccharide biosynthesis protein [Microbacterium aerolatum]